MRTRLSLGATGTPLLFLFAGEQTVIVGRPGGQVRATVQAPLATVRSSALSTPVCGNDLVEPFGETFDGADAILCPGTCRSDCRCPPLPGAQAILHSAGPSVLNNATDFSVDVASDGAHGRLSRARGASATNFYP